jgi:hypothetical protein
MSVRIALLTIAAFFVVLELVFYFRPVTFNREVTSKPTQTPVQTKVQAPPCDSPDPDFCTFLIPYKTPISSQDFYVTLANQEEPVPNSFTLVEDGKSQILMRNDINAKIVDYFSKNGAFSYKTSLESGNKAAIVYTNSGDAKIVLLAMEKVEGNWKIKYILIGNAQGKYLNLDTDTINSL